MSKPSPQHTLQEHVSLQEYAKTNGLEPHAYLTEVYKRLPLATTVEDIEALLPWNLSPKK